MVKFGSKEWFWEKKQEQAEFLKKELAQRKVAVMKARVLRKAHGIKGESDLAKAVKVFEKKVEVKIKKLIPEKKVVKGIIPARAGGVGPDGDKFPLKFVVIGMVGIGAATLYYMRRKKR